MYNFYLCTVWGEKSTTAQDHDVDYECCKGLETPPWHFEKKKFNNNIRGLPIKNDQYKLNNFTKMLGDCIIWAMVDAQGRNEVKTEQKNRS